MDLGLAGRRALVTGASYGIGRAIATGLASEGCSLAVLARSRDKLDGLAEELRQHGVAVTPVAGDLSTAEGVDRAYATATGVLGGVDILVNCTGATPDADPVSGPDEAFVDAMAFKYMSYVRMSRLSAATMAAQGSGGRIVNVVGIGGLQPMPIHLPGGAANAALLLFTKGFGRAVARDGILVNAVNPGPVATERLDHLYAAMAAAEGTTPDEARRKMVSGVPVGREAAPEEIADLVTFLVSDRCRYVAGQYINIDGGLTASI
jgi:NAD(P)-dependent dehydrogenase (short-subunit alcohol dehydrogenase family)